MKVKIKKLIPEAVIPKYAKEGDAGLDLIATSVEKTALYTSYGTGLAIEIPKGYVGLVFPRSSVRNKDFSMANCVGVVDSGYRGEIFISFKEIVRVKTLKTLLDSMLDLITGKVQLKMDPKEHEKQFYEIGDKVAQLIIIPYPYVKFEEVKELSESDRGTSGHGSSGK